jgi:hypothetical protein
MKKYLTEIKWGLIFVAASLLWMIFEKAMGWHGENIEQHPVYTNLFSIVAIAVFVFALLDKRKRDLGGYMTWKQGFMAGLIISLVVAVLSPLAQVITHELITPEYFPNAIEYSVESGEMTQAEAESYFTLGNYMLQNAIGGLVMGVLTSAIVALFVRRRPSAGAAVG